MSELSPKIKITISGKAGSGKTVIARAIIKMLKDNGLKYINHPDCDLSQNNCSQLPPLTVIKIQEKLTKK